MPLSRLPAETIQRAKSVPIERVMDERGIKLKKSGAYRIGPCPICNDGHDRFSIHIPKQVFYCRVCAKGGDVIKFVELYERLEFHEAVRRLAGEPVLQAAATHGSCRVPVATPVGVTGVVNDGPDSATISEPAEYIYKKADGTPYLRVKRSAHKEFSQQHWNGSTWLSGAPDGPRIPYRLPEILSAEHDDIFIVEGEKDADNLAALGTFATTNSGGANNWSPDLNPFFKGKQVFILPDNDGPGRDHCTKVIQNLFGVAKEIRVINLPGLAGKGDVSDWLEAGGTADQLAELMRLAPRVEKSPAPESNKSADLDVVCVADVQPVNIEWLWPNRIAIGKPHALAGEGGLGKSTLLCDWTARTTNGEKWPDGADASEAASVIILASEDAIEDTIAPRLMAAGADLSRVFVIRSVLEGNGKRRSFNLQADLARLEAEVGRRNNVRLVIIDPVSSYLGKIDSHKNADVRSVLDPLSEMAARLRVAVICNNHFSKGGGSANSKVIGSVAFVNAVRAAFIVTPDSEDETRRLLLPSKKNIGTMGSGLAYRIGGKLVTAPDGTEISTSEIMYESAPVTISADQALAALGGNGDNRTGKDEAVDFLRCVLSKGPMSVADIEAEARTAGLLGEKNPIGQNKPFRDAREEMGVTTTRCGFGKGSKFLWSLPPGTVTPPLMPYSTIDGPSEERAPMANGGINGGLTASSSIEMPLTETEKTTKH
jgi:hypothetical protein